MPERIEIKHFDLEFEKNMQTQESYIELHDKYFRYRAQYDSEIPEDKEDLLRGWKSVFYDFDMRLKREYFVSVEKNWNDNRDIWVIEMEINGYPGTVNLYYQDKDKEHMIEVFEKIFKWIFP